jgi:ribonuclease HI
VIEIYTDGSSTGKVGPGGWGFVAVEFGSLIHSAWGGEINTTNNRMEIYAVTQALKYMLENQDPESHFTIWSDSEYVVNGINKHFAKWKVQIDNGKSKIKNQDHWIELMKLHAQLPNATVSWVRGHDGNELNEEADKLAKQGKELAKTFERAGNGID